MSISLLRAIVAGLALVVAAVSLLPTAGFTTGSHHGSGGSGNDGGGGGGPGHGSGHGGGHGSGSGGGSGGGWPWGSSPCAIEQVLSIRPSLANLGTYTPPDMPAAVRVDITIELKTSGEGTCHGALTFYRAGLPAAMRVDGGSATRGYTIQSAPAGGDALLFAAWPPVGRTLDFTVQAGWGTRSVTLPVYVAAASGWSQSGPYADTVLVKVIDRAAGGWRIVRYRPFTVAAAVGQACDLPAPSISSLDFSSAIKNGLANTTSLTVTFSGVACSAPARIRLHGEPLINPMIPPAANFDNFIDWRADATFGAARALLDTRQTNEVTSAARNVVSGATQAGVITVEVQLVAGRPVVAGHYSNVLTVSIDPAF